MKKVRIKKLPLITILVGLFLAVSLLLFIGFFSKKGALSRISLWGSSESIVESQAKDTDNDGLKDWEENLYKTDPLNPDTDGDGFIDGEEIDSGHNPLVKGPGDKQIFYPLPLGDKYNITARVLSDEAIDALLESYISQKQEYIQDHPEIEDEKDFLASTKLSTINEMGKRAIADTYPILIEKAGEILSEIPDIFEISVNDSQIRISEDNSEQIINEYITKISSVITAEDFIFKEKNIETLLRAFNTGDFDSLDKIIVVNDGHIGRLKEAIVPSSWKEVHKNILELSILTRNIFICFRDAEEDFLKAHLAIDELERLPGRWNTLAEKMLELEKELSL